MSPVRPLANDFTVLFQSPDPAKVYTYSPGILVCPDGRLITSIDLGGPGVKDLPGPKGEVREGAGLWQGKVFTSDDGGETWTHRCDYPYMHARPFLCGSSVYILGQAKDLTIIRSDDYGETWSEPAKLTQGQRWHQAPCNVHYAHDCVYLVMERRVYENVRGWAIGEVAPVMMRAKIGDDLTKRESWTFATELAFNDAIPDKDLDYFGVPFFSRFYPDIGDVGGNRSCAPIGWLETNVVQFTDADHVWHDPRGKTFHLWMRAHTGGTNLAAIAKVVEDDDGFMNTMLETAPSGKKMVYVPCPGGQMKFHILYDDETRLFWLLSSQSTDSMVRPESLPRERYNLPNNERHRLQLHFSRNCIDWCFAGLVAKTDSPYQARNYASMAIRGEDLHVLSRSGNEKAKNAHDGNIITFHTIKGFRDLVY